MSSFVFASLFSGSSGNATYISLGGDAILIDAGKNTKCIETALGNIGEDPRKIRAIFVTHEHRDHVAAIPVFSRKYGVPVHCHSACAEMLRDLPDAAVLHDDAFDESVGPFAVHAFYIPHDSACALGYTVTAGGRKIAVATDMGMLAESVVKELLPCDAALIESNYDEEMLRYGPYGPALKARVASTRGHLSNSDAALLASVLARGKTKRILFGHLSKENNTPEKVGQAVISEFERRGVTAYVGIASRDDPTVLWRED